MLIESSINKSLELAGIQARVRYKAHSMGKIARKVDEVLEESYNPLYLEIVVVKRSDCYDAMNIIQNSQFATSSSFKDFIETPKTNMRRYLQTEVHAFNLDFKVKVFDEQLYMFSKYGYMMYWRTNRAMAAGFMKDSLMRNSADFQRLMKYVETIKDPLQFSEAISSDILAEHDYVKDLCRGLCAIPKGSTVMDYAQLSGLRIEDYSNFLVNGNAVSLDETIPPNGVIDFTRRKQLKQDEDSKQNWG